jgi:hypothetical protein
MAAALPRPQRTPPQQSGNPAQQRSTALTSNENAAGGTPRSSNLPEGTHVQLRPLLERNRAFTATGAHAGLAIIPRQQVFLVTCLGLTGKEKTQFGKMSGGQRQRLSIALALVGRPEVAVLDELTTGLDPQARRDTEFHLKMAAAGQAGLAGRLGIVDAQRREVLRRLRDAQRTAMGEPDRSPSVLLLEGIVLRLQADLRWLETYERALTERTTSR